MAVQQKQWQDTGRRLMTIAIGAPAVLLTIVIGLPVYAGVVLLVGLLGAIEFYQMLGTQSRGLVIVAPLIVLTSIASAALGQYWLLGGALLFIGVSSLGLPRHDRTKLVYLVLGGLYIGLPLSFLLPLRQAPVGLWWTLVLFIANWTTDGFALAGGRLFGRHQLAPQISAGKTIEGALCGLLLGTLFGVGTAVLGQLDVRQALLISLLIAILSIMGDLLESRIKRFFHVKDSSSLLPGHGGFLDRMDGLLLATPVVYVLVTLL